MMFIACKVEQCAKNSNWRSGGCRGWCKQHYARWQRHGDPLAGRTPNGEAQEYIKKTVLTYQGDGCLIWPFGGTIYAHVRIDGHPRNVHRLVCEAVHGPPPSPQHEAAHSCGNGFGGCVAPGHLRWKTPSENHEEKRHHGTMPLGERHGMSKLTAPEVEAIRSLRGQLLQREIAERFGVSPSTIGLILRGKIWASLQRARAAA